MSLRGGSAGERGRRRQAPVKARPFEYSHLDLENLVVALLAGTARSYPNALHSLGYRLHHWDAEISLLGEDGRRIRDVRPDAVAHHEGRNVALVIECKAGTDVGFHQVPEGGGQTVDQWAEALALPRRGQLGGPDVKGMIVSTTTALDDKRSEIVSRRISWLRVDKALAVDPDHLSDDRVAEAIAQLPARPWPRTFVPFSADTTVPGGLESVIGAIGPQIVEAAAAGREFVEAEALARRTHAAVWNVTDARRRTAWVGAVAKALEALARGRMQDVASYDRTLRRIRLLGVREGVAPAPSWLGRLRQAIAISHRQVQRSRSRVRIAATSKLQTTLFGDEDLL